MAKFNLKIFQKGKPIYWILGGLILFIIFYILFSRTDQQNNSNGINVSTSGPSEAMQAASLQAQTQMQTAQLAAQVEMARVQGELASGQLGAQVALAQLGSAESIALAQLSQENAIANLAAQTQIIINDQNTDYSLESSRLAAETQIASQQMSAAILVHQLNVNQNMLEIQSSNLIAQAAIGQIGNLKKKDRDNALIALTSSLTGNPVNYVEQSGGGIFGGLIPFVSPLVNAIA